MAKKYYAVKVGSNTGVFETWEECKDSIDGYPGALYKSFKNISDAYAYLGLDGEQLSIFTLESSDKPSSQTIPEQDTTDTDKPFSTDIKAVAYVDGSFNVETGVFGYGVVMFHNGEEIHLSDSSDDKEMASMRNVAGEIYGSMAAMEYAIEHNIKNLSIDYDYMGIAKWCTGEWKTNNPGTNE